MHALIGPILLQEGCYAFDLWTPQEGLSRGYPYRRIEDAYYARKAELRRPGESHARPIVACNAVDEFTRATTVLEATARLGSRQAA